MPRKAQLLNSLSRGRVRASWNKYNLYNLYKKSRVNFTGQNLYQQKWTAKQETRAYHGEHLTESRFQSDFSSKLESVAHLDASLRGENNVTTPLPLQTYAVLEKRLDFALFRAMFASSIRQARQFILQGAVTVNGINIKQPGFTLQAGDIFHVAPEKVLSALGSAKPSVKEAVKVDSTQIAKWNKFVKNAINNPKTVWEAKQSSKSGERSISQEDKIKAYNKGLQAKMLAEQKAFTRQEALKQTIQLGSSVETPTLETFQAKFTPECAEISYKLFQKLSILPEFTTLQALKAEDLSKVLTKDASLSAAQQKQYTELKQLASSLTNTHQQALKIQADSNMLDSSAKTIPYDPKWTNTLSFHGKLDKAAVIEDEKSAKVDLPWQKGLYGRADPTKTYFTPWKVRPFIAPFAILPAHIEVSFETCHAVYMRDPVALPGKSEVISPFGLDVQERAYMWYTRRVKNGK